MALETSQAVALKCKPPAVLSGFLGCSGLWGLERCRFPLLGLFQRACSDHVYGLRVRGLPRSYKDSCKASKRMFKGSGAEGASDFRCEGF